MRECQIAYTIARPPGAGAKPQKSMDCETIKQLIEAELPGAEVTVSGDDGVHFQATVVADQFEGAATLARHRMVYAALGERLGGEIHALSLRTLTPGENG